MMWCRGCYTDHHKDDFPNSGKETGRYWEEELEIRSEKLKSGDHILMYLQRDLCHFWNMKGRYTDSQRMEYDIFMVNIRRAYLDSLWSQKYIIVK